MNDIAHSWYYAELCAHDQQDSGDGDEDLADYIRDKVKGPIVEFSNELEYCYVLELPDRILVVFRGTRGRKAWLNNARVLPPYVEGYMHRGFFDLMEYFYPHIRDALNLLGNHKPLYFTGHSLGGIMSQYAAKFMWERMGLPSTCINFGAPCGGIVGWGVVMNSYPIHNVRVVNGRDIVTEVLDDTIGAHAGLLLKLPRPLWFERIPVLQLWDHAYSSYTKSLIKYCERISDKEGAKALKDVLKRCTI